MGRLGGAQRDPAASAAQGRALPGRAGSDAIQAIAGVVHAQRLEDAAGDGLAEETAGGAEHDVADQAEGHVLVRVAVARRALHRRVGALVHQRAVVLTALDETVVGVVGEADARSEEHTSELQSLMRTSYAVFCLKKNTQY